MVIFTFSGGSLTKIAYYSTVSYKRALYSLDEQQESHVCSEIYIFYSNLTIYNSILVTVYRIFLNWFYVF